MHLCKCMMYACTVSCRTPGSHVLVGSAKTMDVRTCVRRAHTNACVRERIGPCMSGKGACLETMLDGIAQSAKTNKELQGPRIQQMFHLAIFLHDSPPGVRLDECYEFSATGNKYIYIYI